MQKPRIEIVADSETLADRMVELFVSTMREAVSSRGVFRTALSGGRTPEAFLRRLADRTRSNPPGRGPARSLPWDKVHVFWVDERYIPPDSKDSNYRLVAETLLNRVEIPEANVHRIPTEHQDIRDAARAYERTLREVFGLRPGEVPQFDLIILGMGGDGHTASLFPNADAVHNRRDLACAVHVPNASVPDRITLTRSVLQTARRVVVLVCGGDKARTLKEVLAGEPDEAKYPIYVVWPVLDRVLWLVDRDAAGELGEA